MAPLKQICANWAPDNADCRKSGKYGCKNCQVITYCDTSCQKAHWPLHKVACKSPLGKDTWQPAWVVERRTPAFIGGRHAPIFGDKKYLWGNVPAFDLLRLDANEGSAYRGDLRILCAASGDLRHVVKSIAELPSSYRGSMEITLNDRDFDIVARNIILLLIATVVEDVDTASDCMIHLWYSALVRESDFNILQQHVRPVIMDVCRKISDRPSGTLLAKTWTFGQSSIRVVLEKSTWDRLLSFLDVPVGLDAHQAQGVRRNITLAESRKDYRDRYMCCIPNRERLSFSRFREDGILLPFGFPRHEFVVPNPTLFRDAKTWPMPDNADPRHGWPAQDVSQTSSGAASADIFGKLYFYLRAMLSSFLVRLRSLEKVSFELFQKDVSALPDVLKPESFARIDVSNISDCGWLGIRHTLYYIVPLLQNPATNPHATLITLFMNAVDETMTDEENFREIQPNTASSRRLLRYLPPSGGIMSEYDPKLIKFNMARDLVTKYDPVFNRYCDQFEFQKTGEVLGAVMKARHTIIDRWPYRLKLRPGQPGAQEEFDQSLGGGLSSKERYVEWKRTD
ncbi:hypothetical protein BJX64DRAFT_288910 [Aspergillus heterothallicus]